MVQYDAIDFDKLVATPIKETEEIRIRREEHQKMITDNGLEGFFKPTVPRQPTGIVLNYDVEEVKNRFFPGIK